MNRSGRLVALNDGLIHQILNDSNYDIRSNGLIYTLITQTGKISVKNKWRNAGTTDRGYRFISYKGKELAIHRIVYAKFGPLTLSPDLVINHIDSDPSNNDINNLELVSQSQNNYHAFKSGRIPVIGNKKINFTIAQEIRELKQQGYTLKKLCEQFQLAKSTVSYIVNNKTWTKPE